MKPSQAICLTLNCKHHKHQAPANSDSASRGNTLSRVTRHQRVTRGFWLARSDLHSPLIGRGPAVSGFVRETHYFNPADIETGGQRPSGSRPGPGASDWSDTALLLAVNGDLIRHLPCQQPWPQPLLQRVHLWQDARDWQEALLSSSSGQTAGSFYRYFHQSLSFGISDDNHDEVCWVEILSLLAWPGEKLHCLCHSGLGRSEPRMSSRNVILMWTWTMRKSILQNLSLMTGVSQYYSSSSLLTRETRPVLVLTMIQDSDNYFAVNISQPCIWWPESAWASRDLGSYKLTDPWLNIWIQTHDTLYCRDKNIQTTRQEASPGLAWPLTNEINTE